MIFMVLPFIVDIVKMRLLIATPNTGGFSISGHIEWFDLINETLEAFLVIPLYRIFSLYLKDIKKIFSSIFIVSVITYLLFQIFVYTYTSEILFVMRAKDEGVLLYLRLETIAFILGFISSIATAYFVSNNEYKVVKFQCAIKIICYVVILSFLIPRYNVYGIAYGNILTNCIFALIFIYIFVKRKLFNKIIFDRIVFKEWISIGIFTGGEIFLNNIIYSLIVCRMVNAVSMQGVYWAINNVIWGLFLIPFLAMNEIIKTQINLNFKEIWKYWRNVFIIVYVGWAIAFIMPKTIIVFTTGLINAEMILLFRTLLIYYIVYGFTSLFDGHFIAKGKSRYLFYISLFVNIVYYGIVYILYLNGFFIADLSFIVHMFGIGMVMHLILDIFFLKMSPKTSL